MPTQKAMCLDGYLMKNGLFCCQECVLSHLILSHILGGISPSYLLSQGEVDWKVAGVRTSLHLAHVLVLLRKESWRSMSDSVHTYY